MPTPRDQNGLGVSRDWFVGFRMLMEMRITSPGIYSLRST